MPQSSMMGKTENRPIQQRAMRTEQALLDALETLLSTKSFQELTVSQIAAEAGVTTGAIYRRFKDKEDLLHCAFVRFFERTKENASANRQRYNGLSDRQILETFLTETMKFTLSNIPLMRAANSIDDASSFELMTAARSLSARLLAKLLKTSPYTADELELRCKFVLRIATATFRDTFLSGTGAVTSSDALLPVYEDDAKALVSELVEMSAPYLQVG